MFFMIFFSSDQDFCRAPSSVRSYQNRGQLEVHLNLSDGCVVKVHGGVCDSMLSIGVKQCDRGLLSMQCLPSSKAVRSGTQKLIASKRAAHGPFSLELATACRSVVGAGETGRALTCVMRLRLLLSYGRFLGASNIWIALQHVQ